MNALGWFGLVFMTFLSVWTPIVISSTKKISSVNTDPENSRSIEECAALGFAKPTLQCIPTCDALLRVVGDEALYSECKYCCSAPIEDDRYEFAILEVDKRFLGTYKDVETIIRSIEAKKKNKRKGKNDKLVEIPMDVAVRYVFGSRPMLHLYTKKKDSSPVESLNVHAWSVDVFADFFKVSSSTHPRSNIENKKDEL